MAVQPQTDGYLRAIRKDSVANGAMTSVKLANKEVLIARVADKFYAADNICPHMGARLVEGKLDGTILTCPWHASMFDLVDGRILRWTDWTGIKASVSKLFRPPRPLRTYPVKVEGNDILVKVEG